MLPHCFDSHLTQIIVVLKQWFMSCSFPSKHNDLFGLLPGPLGVAHPLKLHFDTGLREEKYVQAVFTLI